MKYFENFKFKMKIIQLLSSFLNPIYKILILSLHTEATYEQLGFVKSFVVQLIDTLLYIQRKH